MNAEALKKNRFWILLPVVILLWLGSLWMISGLKANTKAAYDEASGVKKQVDQINPPDARPDNWLREMKKKTKAAEDLKLRLWYAAYAAQNDVPIPAAPPAQPEANPNNPQAAEEKKPERVKPRDPLVLWPKPLENVPAKDGVNFRPYTFATADYGELLGLIDDEYKRKWYVDQFKEIYREVDPLDEKAGTGSVRFLGSGGSGSDRVPMMMGPEAPSRRAAGGEDANYRAFLAVMKPRPFTDRLPVLEKEYWLNQEEAGLKRELLRIVKGANDTLGILEREWREVTVPAASAAEKKNSQPTDPAAPKPPVPPAGPAGTPAGPVASGAPAAADAKDTKDKEKPHPQTLERKRFQNLTWQVGLQGIKEPVADFRAAWILDLELVPQGNDLILKGAATNYSAVKVPPLKVRVFLSDGGTREEAVEVDAGDVPASPRDPKTGQITTPGKRDLAPTKVRKGAKLITRVAPAIAAPAKDHDRFVNVNWLVDVQLLQGMGGELAYKGIVYNRSGRRLSRVPFRIFGNDERGQDFDTDLKKEMEGLPLHAWETVTFQKEITRGKIETLAAVQQILDYRTVPVKRVDRLEVGQIAHMNSDRRKTAKLEEYKGFSKKGLTEAASPQTSTTSSGPSTSGPPGPGGPSAPSPSAMMGPMMMGGGGMASGAETGKKTPNHNVPEERYTESTDELRRIPIALVLIVDQAHINDVLTAVGNNRLRIQVTMDVWTRVGPLPRPDYVNASRQPPREGGGPAFDSRRMGAMMGQIGRGQVGGFAASEEDSSLVELQVYGEAVIYENPVAQKIRDAEPKPAGGAQAAQPQ